MSTGFHQLADAVLTGVPVAAEDALGVLRADDAELMAVVATPSTCGCSVWSSSTTRSVWSQ